MAGKFSRGWSITKQSWGILRQDKHLLLFPILSGLVCLLVAAATFGPWVLYVVTHIKDGSKEAVQAQLAARGPGHFLVLFVTYFLCFSIVTYFNTALVACVMNRFNGGDSSAKAGLRLATSRLPRIFAWALVNATVGVLLNALKERVGWLARFFLGGVELMWNVATFFVVPVLVVEDVGPIDAVKRSVDVLRKTWGESLVAQFGSSIVLALAAVFSVVGGVVIGVVGMMVTDSPVPLVISILIGFILACLVALISSTLRIIMIAACYRYASTGESPSGFDPAMLQSMFKSK
jgi:uncharacterized protein (DUF697 family)